MSFKIKIILTNEKGEDFLGETTLSPVVFKKYKNKPNKIKLENKLIINTMVFTDESIRLAPRERGFSNIFSLSPGSNAKANDGKASSIKFIHKICTGSSAKGRLAIILPKIKITSEKLLANKYKTTFLIF